MARGFLRLQEMLVTGLDEGDVEVLVGRAEMGLHVDQQALDARTDLTFGGRGGLSFREPRANRDEARLDAIEVGSFLGGDDVHAVRVRAARPSASEWDQGETRDESEFHSWTFDRGDDAANDDNLDARYRASRLQTSGGGVGG